MSSIESVDVIKTSFSHSYQDRAGKVFAAGSGSTVSYFDSRATIDFGECAPGCVSLGQANSIEYQQFGDTPARVWAPAYWYGSALHFVAPLGMDPGLIFLNNPDPTTYQPWSGDSSTFTTIQETLAREGITYNAPGSPSNLYNHNNFLIVTPVQSHNRTENGSIHIRSCNVPVNIDIRGASCTYDTGILLLSSTGAGTFTLPKLNIPPSNKKISHVLPSGPRVDNGGTTHRTVVAAYPWTNNQCNRPQQQTSVQSINFGEYTKNSYARAGNVATKYTYKGLSLNTWVLSLYCTSTDTKKIFQDTNYHLWKEVYVAESDDSTTFGSEPSKYILACQLESPYTNTQPYYDGVISNNRSVYPFVLEDTEPDSTDVLNFNHIVNTQWNWKVNYNTHLVDPQLVNSFDFNRDELHPRGLAIGHVYTDNTGNLALSGSDSLKIGDSDGITMETYFRVPDNVIVSSIYHNNVLSYHLGTTTYSNSIRLRCWSDGVNHRLYLDQRNFGPSGYVEPPPPETGYYNLRPMVWFHIAITVDKTEVYVIVNGQLALRTSHTDSNVSSILENPGTILLNTKHGNVDPTSLQVGSGIDRGFEYTGLRVYRGDRYGVKNKIIGDTIFTLNENNYCYSSRYGANTDIPAVLAPYKYPEDHSNNGPFGGTEVVRITTIGSVSAQQSNGHTAELMPLNHYGVNHSKSIPLNTNISQYNTVTSARLEITGFGDGASVNFIGKEDGNTRYVGTTSYDLSINDVTLDKDKDSNWTTPIFKSDDNSIPVTLLEVLEHKLNTESTKGIAYIRSLPQVTVGPNNGFIISSLIPDITDTDILKYTGYPILGNISVNTVTGSISSTNSNTFNVDQPDPIQTIKFDPYNPTLPGGNFNGQVTPASLSATIGSDPHDIAVITDQPGTIQYSISANDSISSNTLTKDIIALNITTAGAKRGKRAVRQLNTYYNNISGNFNIPPGEDKTQYGVSLPNISTTVSGLSGKDLTIEVS